MLVLKKLTEEEINKLPYPETARLLGGIIYIKDEVDGELVDALRKAWDDMHKEDK